MTATVFVDVNNKVARAAQTGTALPAVSGRLLAYLKIIVKFFDGDDLVEIDADTAKLVVKPKSSPTAAASLLDTTAALVTGPAYEFVFDPADSSALRTVLDAQAEPHLPLEMRAEVEYQLGGEIERVAFPIFFDTAYNRPDDEAPAANEDASWEWLKARAPEANGFSHDDVAKELTVTGGGGGGGSTAWADITGKPSSFTPSAHASSHGSAGSDPITIAQSQVTGLTSDLAGKASSSHSHSSATSLAAGFMSSTDKSKLDGIEANADVTDATNVAAAGAVMTGGALGTPSSGTLTHCGGLPLSTGVTGALPIANGGTGSTTASDARTALGLTNATASLNLSGLAIDGNVVVIGSGGITAPAFDGDGSLITGLNAANISSGALAVANGGTGSTTAAGARGALLPSKTGNAGKYLTVKSDESDFELTSPASPPPPSDEITVGTTTVASSTDGHLLYNNAGTLGSATLATLLEALSSTQGTVIYRGSSGWAALAPGTSGQVLQTGGAGANPSWATPSGGSGGGGASNVWIPASAFIPRSNLGAGVDSRELSTNKQNFDELLFDAGSDEYAQALVMMPNNYDAGTFTARFYWTAASGSGGVVWGIQARAFGNDDALDAASGTAQTVADTLLAADDMHVTDATLAVTAAGTPGANKPMQFQIYRKSVDLSDTLAVDARLLGVEILYTSV